MISYLSLLFMLVVLKNFNFVLTILVKYRTALVHETKPLVLALSHFVYGLSPRCHRKSPLVGGTYGDRKFKRVTKQGQSVTYKKTIFRTKNVHFNVFFAFRKINYILISSKNTKYMYIYLIFVLFKTKNFIFNFVKIYFNH